MMAYEDNFKSFLNKGKISDEDPMTQKEMNELQEAIDKSKEIGSIETEIEPKKFYKAGSDEAPKEKLVSPKPGLKGRLSLQKNLVTYTFQDLPESTRKFLAVNHHKPAFELPVPTNPKFKKYSIQTRAKLLSEHFTRIEKLAAKQARRSLFRAPFPKPLSPGKNRNSHFKNGFDGDDNIDEVSDPISDLYISRAGRTIKRKNYTEDAGNDIETEPFDYPTPNKKNKTDSFDDTSTKITLDTPYIPEENEFEEKPKPVKPRKDTPRKITNFSSLRKPRAEAMFDKLLENDEKKKQQEAEMQNFEKTLPTLVENSQEDDLIIESSPVKENDENFIRRRVSPPNPAKKVGRAKRASKQGDPSKSENNKSPPTSPVLRRNAGRSRLTKSQKSNEIKEEKSLFQKIEKVSCPICNGLFLQTEIEDHASSCGIEEDQLTFRDLPQTSNNIECHLCNRKFAANSEYEVHVRHCIASDITNL